MPQKADLEEHIHESRALIQEFGDIRCLSDQRRESLRVNQETEVRWRLIEGWSLGCRPPRLRHEAHLPAQDRRGHIFIHWLLQDHFVKLCEKEYGATGV